MKRWLQLVIKKLIEIVIMLLAYLKQKLDAHTYPSFSSLVLIFCEI